MKVKYLNLSGTILPLLSLVVLLSGCSDWLNVDPIDKISENQVYSSEQNIQQALNGIYLQMGKNALYGQDLSVSTLELLGQQYASDSETGTTLKYYLLNHVYTTDVVKNKLLSIWSESYSAILNINNFIDNINNVAEGVIGRDRKILLLGEAYGLRAYLHLDLLRLFGPVYQTSPSALSIPYRDRPIIEYSERISAAEVMGKILTDLDVSINYLKDDPVITEGVMALPEDSLSSSQKKIDKFYRYRNRRMNYYAASALKVRALMYQGDKESAASLANTLLASSAIPDKFPWASNEDVFRIKKQDRIFSKEVLFGIHSQYMYSNWTEMFSPGITVVSALYAPLTQNIETLFEVSPGQLPLCTDWRSKNWLSYSNAEYSVTYKLSKSTDETDFWYFQPLIRKAELYYALAECEGKVSHLDEVRTNRNIKKVEELRPDYNLDNEIQNEFIREMHNEGQIFFFYKRKNLETIPSGSSASVVSMSESKYVAPVPQRELDK